MSLGRVPGARGSMVVAALWLLTTLFRYYFLDYDGGSDGNPGYVDAAAGTIFTAGAAGIAIKTMERLYEIVPQLGNGRSIVILQKLRAGGVTYLKKDGVTADSIDTSRWSGYRTFLWRGSTDLSNDLVDRVTCGFQTVIAGPNGDGSFTVTAGATTTLVPIAAGVIAAEAATQYRIRFLPTTTTVALRNICRNITSMVANTSVTTGAALPAVPANGDVFVIEGPGVLVDQILFDVRNLGTVAPSAPAPQLVGISASTTTLFGITINGYRMLMSGIEQTAPTANFVWQLNFVQFFQSTDAYTDESSAARAIGMGIRLKCSGTWSAVNTMNVQCPGAMNLSATQNINAAVVGGFGLKGYLGGIITCRGPGGQGCRQSPGALPNQFYVGDPTATNAQPRVVSGGSITPFSVVENPVNLWRLNFEGFGAATHGQIYVKDCVGGSMNIDGCTSDGTGPYGMDITGSHGVTVKIGNTIANTNTGTTCDILLGSLGGGAQAAWTDFTKVGYRDPNGNTLMGTAGLTSGETIAVTNNSGGALAPGNTVFLSAASTVQKSNANAAGTAHLDGVMVSTCANAALGLMAPPSGVPYLLYQNAVAAVSQLNLSAVTAGTVTDAVPGIVVAVGRTIDGNGVLTAGRVVLNNK